MLIKVVFFVMAGAACASGQMVDAEFVYGRDYTFERLVATRKVHDAEDKGTIRLMTYVYRPLKNDRHEVVLFSHGSTGGQARSPKILGRLIARESRILLAGHSRGGFLSLILAGERPTIIKGVVNFAGGWYGVTDKLTAVENQQRMEDYKARLMRAAKRASAPTIWFYAVRDPFYKDGVPQELHRYWQDAGGGAEFVFIARHSLPNAHLALSDPKVWEQQADAFLKTIGTVKR